MTGDDYAEGGIYAYDSDEILDQIVELFQDWTDWHSFRTRSEIEEAYEDGRVTWIHKGGEVVCAATYRHLESKPYSRVYFSALRDDEWDVDRWKQMIRGVLLESPYDRIISKTPMEIKEADLWRKIAEPIRIEPGKNRPLAVWEVRSDTEYGDLTDW